MPSYNDDSIDGDCLDAILVPDDYVSGDAEIYRQDRDEQNARWLHDMLKGTYFVTSIPPMPATITEGIILHGPFHGRRAAERYRDALGSASAGCIVAYRGQP